MKLVPCKSGVSLNQGYWRDVAPKTHPRKPRILLKYINVFCSNHIFSILLLSLLYIYILNIIYFKIIII